MTAAKICAVPGGQSLRHGRRIRSGPVGQPDPSQAADTQRLSVCLRPPLAQERLLASGDVHEKLQAASIEDACEKLKAAGVEAVAVSFLHSFTNDGHEQAAREALARAAPGLRVSISSEVVPEISDELLAQSVQNPELLDVLRRLGLRSYIGVPLTVRGPPQPAKASDRNWPSRKPL